MTLDGPHSGRSADLPGPGQAVAESSSCACAWKGKSSFRAKYGMSSPYLAYREVPGKGTVGLISRPGQCLPYLNHL